MFTHNTTTTKIVFYVGNPSAIIHTYMRHKDLDKCRNMSQYSTQYVIKYRADWLLLVYHNGI
jgi:hypothetical protein